MISAGLFAVVQCPDCAGTLTPEPAEARCERCGRRFEASRGFLDLRPQRTFDETTKYLDEALHADARHASVAPPLLGSSVRLTMLRRFLALGAADRAVDLGCGSGRTLAWNAASGAQLTGIDIAPYFAAEALAQCDLVLGELRQLPLRDGAFTRAWSLDVLEHLPRPALFDMLREANRVLAPGGALFVYSHVRKNGPMAGGVRAVNRLAAWCERHGLIDLAQERLRKSDHVNPLTDHEDLTRVAAECGFHIERRTYYTPVLGALIENVFARIVERQLQRRAARRRGSASVDPAAVKAARADAKARVSRGGPTAAVLRILSAAMMLDVILFGRVRSGPFFALLRKTS
jgi:SAM-dependent methyltransferase